MIAAGLAWEIAGNSGGRFRLGLGSQVKAHVERRYGMLYGPPGPRMRDYIRAVKDCVAAFRGDRPLEHDGPYYAMSLLPDPWLPPCHECGDAKVDVSAVGPWTASSPTASTSILFTRPTTSNTGCSPRSGQAPHVPVGQRPTSTS